MPSAEDPGEAGKGCSLLPFPRYRSNRRDTCRKYPFHSPHGGYLVEATKLYHFMLFHIISFKV